MEEEHHQTIGISGQSRFCNERPGVIADGYTVVSGSIRGGRLVSSSCAFVETRQKLDGQDGFYTKKSHSDGRIEFLPEPNEYTGSCCNPGGGCYCWNDMWKTCEHWREGQ